MTNPTTVAEAAEILRRVLAGNAEPSSFSLALKRDIAAMPKGVVVDVPFDWGDDWFGDELTEAWDPAKHPNDPDGKYTRGGNPKKSRSGSRHQSSNASHSKDSISKTAMLSKQDVIDGKDESIVYKADLGDSSVIAYWDDANKKIVVGDAYFGHGDEDRIDIVAHEIGHGIVSALSKDVERSQNEFFPLVKTGIIGSWNDEKGRFVGYAGQRTPDEALADAAKDYLIRPDALRKRHGEVYGVIDGFMKTGKIDIPGSGETKIGAWASKRFKDPSKAAAFTKWFGDSQVVDDDGNPLTVFHGTRGDFDSFKRDTKNAWSDSLGFDTYFFSRTNSTASSYKNQFEDGKVMKVKLSIQRPLVIDANGGEWFDALAEASDQIRTYRTPEELAFLETSKKVWDSNPLAAEGLEELPDSEQEIISNASKKLERHIVDNKAMYQSAKRKLFDYDGIIVKNVMDMTAAEPDSDEGGSYNPYTTVFVAFDPGQIKSAKGNRGTFDSASDSINEAVRSVSVGTRLSEGVSIAGWDAARSEAIVSICGRKVSASAYVRSGCSDAARDVLAAFESQNRAERG
jgi:hypothetical protein